MWHLIRAVLLLIPRILWDYFAWMLRYSGKKKDKVPLEKRYGKVRSLLTKVLKRLRVDIIVLGKENMPKEKSCYYANHLGACDPLMYFPIFEEPVSFLAKIEIKKMPFVGRVFTATDGAFLKRDDLKQQLKVMMGVQKALENKSTNFFVFPEGTRNKDQMKRIADFHHGTFRAAMKAKVPLVPVVNYGSFRILSTKKNYKRYPAIIKFLPPIYPEEYEGKSTEEVAKMIQSIIQRELSFSVRKIDQEYMAKVNGKKYRFNEVF